MDHSSICICAGWGRSNNDLSSPRQANRGRETVPGLILNSMSNDNLLKREAVYSCSQSRKVKISFRRKYEAVGGAGEGAAQEYAQIWERKVGSARRCLGKGTAADKQVLKSALERVLRAEEMETSVQMECEELGSKEMQIENADNLRIPFKETTLTINTNTNLELSQGEHMAMEIDLIELIQNENTSQNSSTLSNLIGNEMERKSLIKTNPSLCKSKTKSEVERVEWSQDVTHIS